MKMNDMGQTNKERYGETMSPESEKDKKYYETFTITDKQMPDMPEYHAGDKCIMCVEFLVRAVTKKEEGKESKTDYKLELRKMGKMPKGQKEINPYKKSDEE